MSSSVKQYIEPGHPCSAAWCKAAAVALALVLGGCASVPPPTDAIAAAQSQLQAARDAHAKDYAPVDLDFAQSRMDQAQAAMNARKYAMAADLASESQADSQLALTRAKLGALNVQIKKMSVENTRLRAQLLQPGQSSGAAAPTASPVQNNNSSSGVIELPQQILPMPASAGTSASITSFDVQQGVGL